MDRKAGKLDPKRRAVIRAAMMTGGFSLISTQPAISQMGNVLDKTGPSIKEVMVTPIAIADPPLLNAAGLHAPYALRLVVELVTDDGISGISELHGGETIRQAMDFAAASVVGKDPFQLHQIYQHLSNEMLISANEVPGKGKWNLRMLRRVYGAIEVACLDIIGKIVERPLVDLLGGRVRDRVPFAAYLFYKHEGAGGPLGFEKDPLAEGWLKGRQEEALDPAGMVEQALAMTRQFGFKSLKVKGGVFEPQIEVDTVRALRDEFGPGVPVRLDPNAAWKVETAIKYGKEMEGFLEYFEDPVRSQENMATVRKALSIPMATNMCTTAFEHLPGSIEMGSEDIILTDHHYWGGLKACMELARICATFGRGVSMHSNSHLGISMAAMVHLGAAYPFLTADLDTHYPWQIDEVITQGRFYFEEGAVEVPSGPGLGVELDRKQLARLHQNYLDCGLTERNDQIEMQKIKPGWERIPERW